MKGLELTVEVTVNSQDESTVVAPDPSVPGRYTVETTRTTTTVTRTSVDVAVTVSEPPPPAPEMYLGMTALPGTEWDSCLAYYGADKLAAIRLFGKDNLYTPNDADTLTEWQKWNTEKWAGVNKKALAVLSVKDDPTEFLDAWALTFPPTADLAALGFPGTAASYWHEPEDDVRGGAFDWATFRQRNAAIANWRNTHPRGKELIHWVGPILTRYDLMDLNNDPINAGFEGMNIFMFDAYQSSPSVGSYWSPQMMVGDSASRIQARYPGIAMGIPEFGYARQTNDTTGVPWADAHEALVNYMRADGRFAFAIAFNSAGSMPQVPFYTSGPVALRYRDQLLRSFV